MAGQPPKRGNGSHVRLKPFDGEKPAVPGMASYAGEGPAGTYCRDCVHFGVVAVQTGVDDVEINRTGCAIYAQRMGHAAPTTRRDIRLFPACKHFVAGDEFEAALHHRPGGCRPPRRETSARPAEVAGNGQLCAGRAGDRLTSPTDRLVVLPQEPLFRPKGAPQLRDYQRAVVERIATAIQGGRRRLLLPAPTGSGKTVIAAQVAADAATANQRVLFLVHRRELVQQASRKLYDVGLDHGIIAAGFPARPDAPVQVASISTLHRRAVRSSAMPLPEAEMLVVDEAHHAPARTWTRIIKSYPAAVVFGLTATPCRADGRGLGTMFECLIDCPSIRELIELGYLVPTRVFAPTKPDLEGIRTIAGDFDEDQLEERLDKPVLVGDIVTHWHRLADRRRTVVFAISRAHAVHLRDEFARSGVVAGYLDGDTPMQERDRILDQLKRGTIEVLVNVGVLTEGWDQPEVQCIVLARPTKSFGLYRQIVGRGLRPAPGKDHLLVLDHAGATHMHQPVETDVIWTLSDKERARPVLAAAAEPVPAAA